VYGKRSEFFPTRGLIEYKACYQRVRSYADKIRPVDRALFVFYRNNKGFIDCHQFSISSTIYKNMPIGIAISRESIEPYTTTIRWTNPDFSYDLWRVYKNDTEAINVLPRSLRTELTNQLALLEI
jgi:hypothetical protein